MDRKSRDILLHQKSRKQSFKNSGPKDKPLVFSTPYSKDFQAIKKIINKYIPVLDKDHKLALMLKKECKIVPRRGKTLGNLLLPSEFVEIPPKTWMFTSGFFLCHDNRCVERKFSKQCKDFSGTWETAKTYKIHSFLNCNTTHVVYCIMCTCCNLKYIGCTKRKLKKRISEHISDVMHKRTNVGCSQTLHRTTWRLFGQFFQFFFFGLERVIKPRRGGNWLHKLHVREAFWILHLNTRFPSGLHFRTDLSYIY